MSNNRYNFDEDPELFTSRSFLRLTDSPTTSFFKFRKKAFASNFEETRTEWLSKALHKHIMKGYPHRKYSPDVSLEEYYSFLSDHIDHDKSPPELIQEIITNLINHLDFDNYPRDPVYGYLKVNSIVICNIYVLSRLLYRANDEIKEYYFVKVLQFILRQCQDPRPAESFYARSFEYQAIQCLNEAVNQCSVVIYFKCLSEKSILKKQLDEYGRLGEVNRTILYSILGVANRYYPGYVSIYGSTIDTERAFRLYSAIPEWATAEYAEAQFWIAKLICYHSNYTPENFATETVSNKKKRMLAMKPYVYAAAVNGNGLAKFEKTVFDESLEKLIAKGIKRTRSLINEPNKSQSTERLAMNGFFMKAPAQVITGTSSSISTKRLKF
jgi:hypothetical protein